MSKRLYSADVNIRADTLIYTYRCGREGEHAPARGTAKQKIKIKEISDLADKVSKALCSCDVSNLKTLGGTLYDRLIPKKFASVIAPLQGAVELRQQPPQNSFVFYLLNPKIAWIPWELLYDGDAFLCRRFCVSRSLVKTGDEFELAQKRLDALRRPGVIVLLGDTSGLDTNKEIEEILRILTPVIGNDRIVVRDATNKRMTVDYLKENYDICHFIGHGVFSTKSRKDSGWRLRDGTVLTCSDIEGVKSPKAVFPRLIIANSCYSARSASSPSNAQKYVTSLYRSFLSMGVPQYIGTIASVPDDVSQVFTSAFYTALASGKPVGEAVFQAREAASAGPGWGYYVHYGDPGFPFLASTGSTVLPITAPNKKPTWHPPLDERVEESLRSDDLYCLRSALQNKRVLAIIGEAKIGKTSLASLLALQLEAELGVIVLYHDFRLDTTAILLERFLEKVGVTPRPSFNDNVTSFLSVLNDRPCFVLLDNFEVVLNPGDHTISDPKLTALVDLLLAGKFQHSYVVCTSRYPIRTRKYNAVPEFCLKGIKRALAIPYLVTHYHWSPGEATHIYNLRAGNPHAIHVCSIVMRERQQLGLSFADSLRSVRPLATELIFRELANSLNDVEQLVLRIAALHPLGLPVLGIERIVHGVGLQAPASIPGRLFQESINSHPLSSYEQILYQYAALCPFGGSRFVNALRKSIIDGQYLKPPDRKPKQPPLVVASVRGLISKAFRSVDVGALVTNLHRRGLLTIFGKQVGLLPEDQAFFYEEQTQKAPGTNRILHQLAHEYYFSLLASEEFQDWRATRQGIREAFVGKSSFEPNPHLYEDMYYHAAKGYLFYYTLLEARALAFFFRDNERGRTYKGIYRQMLEAPGEIIIPMPKHTSN